jgi:hypothetical protein
LRADKAAGVLKPVGVPALGVERVRPSGYWSYDGEGNGYRLTGVDLITLVVSDGFEADYR